MHQTTALHPIVKKVFQARGMSDSDVAQFLSWDLRPIPELLGQLQDLDKASQRIFKALKEGQAIGIYGDYDVDGTTSCALFHRFFQNLKAHVSLYQPNRLEEGYGLHLHSIDRAVKDEVQLLITVDCGITNTEAAMHAHEQGLDLIITDHHKDGAPEMPQAFAVVNPNRRDETCDPELRTLAGVGVAFALCVRVRELLLADGHPCPTLYPLLPFVAIGTICDMVKLSPTNLKLVRHGLKAIKTTNYEGLKKCFPPQQRNQENISSEYLSFQVGPLINSKGRLDHPEKALQLLITDDGDLAFQTFNHLKLCNQQRKEIQAQVFEEARDQILSQIYSGDLTIAIAHGRGWHEGVIGIVASKLVETFKVPAIVLCESNKEQGMLKGSARTAGEYNIYEGLSGCSDLFTKFGGHRAAAGLSLPQENLEEFKSRMLQHLKAIPLNLRRVADYFDLNLSVEEISPELALGLELMEPFGPENPRPIFQMRDAVLESFQILKDVHVRWTFCSPNGQKKFQGISFFFIGRWGAASPQELMKKRDEGLTVQFTLGFNNFRGNKFLQLQVINIF